MRPYQDAPIGIPTDLEIREIMRRAREARSFAIRDGLRRLWHRPEDRTDGDALAPDTAGRRA